MQGAHDFTPESYRYCATEITVQKRSATQWCVSNGASVWSKDGQWEYEPLPSNRDEEFFQRTRYSLDEAFMAARAAWRAFLETRTKPGTIKSDN